MILLYLIAWFHKLNDDFVSPVVSCSADLWFSVPWPASMHEHFGPGFVQGLALVILVLELSIPVLLLGRKTLALGVGLACLFHLGLGFVPFATFYNFSSLLIVLYLLWLPDEAGRRMKEALGALQRRRSRPRWGVIVSCLVTATLAWILWERHEPGRALLWRERGVWIFRCLGIGLVGWMLHGLWPYRRKVSFSPLRESIAHPLLWGAVGCFGLSGLCPYLGLKTELSFAMYSNLRTEGHRSNHWVVRKPLDLLGWQSDTVQIQQSSLPALAQLAQTQQGVPWLEFQDLLARDCGIFARYRRQGQLHQRVKGDRSPPFAEPLPWWVRKLVRFRPFDLGEHQRCVH